jgi:hypothetical protein
MYRFRTYSHLFDLTTEVFIKRCLGTLLFWRNDFLTIGQNKFELYGPMWICITYACVLSIAANLALYYNNHEKFAFVAEYIVKAFVVTALFGFLVPLIIGCIVKIMKGDMPALAVTNIVPMYLRLLSIMVYCSNGSLLYPLAVLASWNVVVGCFL